MRRLRRNNRRIDRIGQDVRAKHGTLGKWVYLLILLGLIAWLLNNFLGNLIFFSAQGFVMREEYRVAVPYPARLASLDAEVGDEVSAGDPLARVESLTIRETIAQLSLAIAELERERSRLEARAVEIDALVPVARRRAERMRGLLAQNTDAYERGLTTAINRSVLIEDEFDAAEKVAELTAERGEIDRQIALIDRQRAELEARRAVFAEAYDDGVVRAPVDGQIFDVIASVGGVVRAADPILTMVGGEPHILAYVNPGSLAEMPVGSKVRIEYGVRELEGRITRIFPLSRQLPAEFQRQFRPQERSQLIRIDFAEESDVPPTFTKVAVASSDILPSWARRLLDGRRLAEADEAQGQGPASALAQDMSSAPEAVAATVTPAVEGGIDTEEPVVSPGDAGEPAAKAAERSGSAPVVDMPTEDDPAPAAEDAGAAAVDLAESWRLQLAALDTTDAARTELRRARAAYRAPPGMSYRIAEMSLNGRPVYRIHLGPFASQEEALDHCEWLKEAGRDCFALPPGA